LTLNFWRGIVLFGLLFDSTSGEVFFLGINFLSES